MAHAPSRPHAQAVPYLTDEARSALQEQAAATPDWAPWLRLLETTLAAADHDAWRSADIRFPAARPADAPLLEGARVFIDADAAGALARGLMTDAGHPDTSVDGIALVSAGLDPQEDRLRQAAGPGIDAGAVAALAQFAVRPLLLEAARRARAAIPDDWRQGYCPVCGDWPTLVEQRGLERQRVLRCGRCAAGWHRGVLNCPFCEERDHRRQGSLVPHEGGELVRVETCHACQGYLKSVTTLRAKAPWALALDDLRTLHLELAALERGFRRPDRPGWTLALGVAARPASG
jgi:FdhE protein